MIQRYPDCWRFCELLLSEKNLPDHERTKTLLYLAMSSYHEYNRELAANLKKSEYIPGFEYKETMRNFCKRNIMKVISILSKCIPLITTLNSINEDLVPMLDKALLDCLKFNITEVQICLLCHRKVKKKLIRSHFIPRFAYDGVAKTMGFDLKRDNIYCYLTDIPTDWELKPVSKLTFVMLCDICDNQILSQDENNFRNNFFSKIYNNKTPLSTVSAHCIPYEQYIYRFVAGLVFRNIAPVFSEVCAETGEFSCLLNVMHAFRKVILNAGESQFEMPKLYALALPSELPSNMKNVKTWRSFVSCAIGCHAAYKLLQPGNPMIPKKLYCCMVKIGVLLFVAPFDEELEYELEKNSPQSLIQFKDDTTGVFLIPDNKDRAGCIPQKLLWSLVGFAKNSENTISSNLLTTKLLQYQVMKHLSTDLLANLLPPGFALNLDKLDTPHPEKVVEVPEGHVIILHQPIQALTDTLGYVLLAKQVASSMVKTEGKTGKKTERPAVYSMFSKPYVLIYLKHPRLTVKAGYFINVNDCQLTELLPGCPPSKKDSQISQDLAHRIPVVLCSMLRSKGFRNLQSLLFWHQSMINANTVETERR